MLYSDPNRSEALGHDTTSFISNLPVADRPGDGDRRIWTTWWMKFCLFGTYCTAYEHKMCWGNTIIRMSYDDDAKFTHAVAALQRLAMLPIMLDYEARGTGPARDQPAPEDDGPEVDDDRSIPRSARHLRPPTGTRCTHDWVITHELMYRYHNLVVEDKAALEGADAAAAWQYYTHAGCAEREHGLRGTMFIVMDEEAIDHLAKAPGEEELASMARSEKLKVSWQHWIKVVTPSRNCTEEGEDVDEIPDDPMARRRIRLCDFIDISLWLQHGDVTEMGVEGSDRERFAGYGEEREWEFCENPDEDPDVWPWLEELYGERR